jgi:polyketide cyclase/dehydrase/lipid transport protein
MTQTHFSITVDVPAPPQLVWPVMADLERWPEWTPSVSRVRKLSPGPLGVGSRVRIHQPKLPPALWRVAEVEPNSGFTSVSTAPGVRVTARHIAEPTADGCRVTLSIRYEGLFGPLLARWTRDLNERYLALEAHGLRARCIELASKPYSRTHETH